MSEYQYTREKVNGVWNINNPKDVNANGKTVNLFTRIQEDVSITPICTMLACEDNEAFVYFDADLSRAEKGSLDTLIARHKTAAGNVNMQTALKMVSENGTEYNVCVSNLGVLEVMPA